MDKIVFLMEEVSSLQDLPSHWPSAVWILCQRPRRWHNIQTALGSFSKMTWSRVITRCLVPYISNQRRRRLLESDVNYATMPYIHRFRSNIQIGDNVNDTNEWAAWPTHLTAWVGQAVRISDDWTLAELDVRCQWQLRLLGATGSTGQTGSSIALARHNFKTVAI